MNTDDLQSFADDLDDLMDKHGEMPVASMVGILTMKTVELCVNAMDAADDDFPSPPDDDGEGWKN